MGWSIIPWQNKKTVILWNNYFSSWWGIHNQVCKKKTVNSNFIFPEKDDISAADASQITKVLPDPMMDHRRHYLFP